jgi:hypothetical protein
VNYIDTRALDDVIASGDSVAADAAMAAKEFYTRDYAPFWRDGVLKDVSDLYGQTVGRTSAGMAEQGAQFRPVDFQSGTRQAVEGSLSDVNREQAAQIVQLLNRPEAGRNAPLVTDYVIGKATDDLWTAIESGARLSDIDAATFIAPLREYRNVVAQNFPEEAARINAFIDTVRQGQGNMNVLRTQIDEARVIAKQAEEALYSNELSTFFRTVGIENPNGFDAFSRILRDGRSQDVIDALVARAEASGDPVILRGMQAAYARHVRNWFSTKTRELGGGRPISISNLSDEEEGLRQVLSYGDQIFKDAPEVMGGLRQALDSAGFATRSKGAKPIASDSATAARMEAIRASNQVITQTFGVLNRIGARIRAGTTTIINKASPDELGARMVEALLSDPDAFIKVARGARGTLDADVRDAMFAFLLRTGVYISEDKESFVNAWAQSEMEMRRTQDKVGDQMNQILGAP